MPLPLAYVAGALPFGFLVGVVLLRFAQGADRPRAVVDGFLAWALVSYAASESFGFVRLISMGPFLVCWLAANGIVFYLLWLARGRITKFLRIEFSLPVWIVLIFVVVTLFIALTAAPNNWDSQAYHLPKIEHWLQNHSLEFYPTATAKQNDFGPLAEMLLLQTRVLSGSDIYYPLIQWLSMVASVAAVFRITRQLGGDRSQCWVAAVFLVTLPIGILESTSTQNDYVEAAFLVAFITLGLETMERPFAPLALLIEASCAGIMSGLVKPVGYMTGVGFALWIAIGLSRGARFPALMQRAVAVALVVLVLLGPFASRFVNGAQLGDIEKIQISASFGLEQTVDNIIRHAVTNLMVGISEVDSITWGVGDWITYHLGVQDYRADTTDVQRMVYAPPPGLYIYHEDNGPNQLHTILLILALACTVICWPVRPSRKRLIYCGAWLVGIAVFAAALRFGQWAIRYHLAGFVTGAPIAALAWPPRLAASKWNAVLLICMALTSLPALVFNQTRELVSLRQDQPFHLGRDRPSYLGQSYLERLFANQIQLLEPYRRAIDVIARADASQIGLMMDLDGWEYPIWRMLRTQLPERALRIEHVGLPGTSDWPLSPFVPEVLFWDKGEGDAPAAIVVSGQEFERVSQSGPIIGHPSRVAVYLRSAPR